MTNSKVIAYTRISDSNKQDADTQRNALSEYAKDNNLVITHWVEERVSASKTDVQDRELSKWIDSGHRILMTDATRLGRRKVFGLVGVIENICRNGGELHFAYTNRVITEANMDDAEVIFTVVGGSFAAVEESKSRSRRATAQHKRRKATNKAEGKAEGFGIGRRRGAQVASKLDDYAPDVQQWLSEGLSKAAILRKLEGKGLKIARSRLYSWMKDKNITYTTAS